MREATLAQLQTINQGFMVIIVNKFVILLNYAAMQTFCWHLKNCTGLISYRVLLYLKK